MYKCNSWSRKQTGEKLFHCDVCFICSIGRASLAFAIIASLGTVRAQPRFRSHVKSLGDFSLLQITAI